MKIIVGDKEIPIKETDMKLSRAFVNEAIEVARRGAEKTHSTSLYLTFILMMYKKSSAMLNEIGIDNLIEILSKTNKEES